MSQPARAPHPRFFATAAKGTEALLAEELSELGLPAVRAARGGVYFGQAPVDAYRVCLWSRIALRVHEPIASFECRDGDDLYAGVKAVDWSEYLAGERTLAVRATGQNERLSHTHFIAVRTKDAIVDQLRERRGARPSVDREAPDLLLFVRVTGERATVNLDYSGGSLHERGFRVEEGAAPLRETLAAALVRFSGWRGDTPLVDPMCGSGMLLIEAGLWAARRAPGLSHPHFGFERWSSFDASARSQLDALRGEARAAERPAPPLFGSDADARALDQCRANAEGARLPVTLRHSPLSRVDPGQPGALLANPPYGERLALPEHLTRDLDALIERFGASRRALIVARGFPSRLRATQTLDVFNGPIECELRRYDATGPRLSFRPRSAPGEGAKPAAPRAAGAPAKSVPPAASAAPANPPAKSAPPARPGRPSGSGAPAKSPGSAPIAKPPGAARPGGPGRSGKR